MSRPVHFLDPYKFQIEEMVKLGCTDEHICRVLEDITGKEVKKRVIANKRMCFRNNCYREMEQEGGRMIKVKAEANYGFAGTNMTFEEEFGDDVTDEEIEEAMRDMVMEQVNWSWEKE